MTNIAIKTIINRANTNPAINWEVSVNTPRKIVLTNNYDDCISYSICVKQDCFDDECIVANDNHMDATVCVFCKGLNFWDDYTVTERGLEMAIEAVVNSFNYTY